MRLRKRAVAAVFVATAAFTSLASQAMAAPMPWETSKTPTSTTHHTASTAVGASGTVTVLSGPPATSRRPPRGSQNGEGSGTWRSVPRTLPWQPTRQAREAATAGSSA